MTLKGYHQKRDFKKTPEPKGKLSHDSKYLFVIQKHAASHLHYDFRLELNGVLLSWAVPKGPCLDPTIKRLAVHVEDHPVEYGFFQGIIPKGQYGGGTVMLWDKGVWQPLDDDPVSAYKKGHLRFDLHADKLNGRWDLLRFKDENNWFLIKYKDKYAQNLADFDVTVAEPDSVLTGQTIDEIAEDYDKIWTRTGEATAPDREKKSLNKLQLPEHLMPVPFPDFIPPQLATLTSKAPKGPQWLHEIKFDGYRILAFIHDKDITLKSRNDTIWTENFKSVVKALKPFTLKNIIFDGEIVLLDKSGRSDFQLLQNSIKEGNGDYVYYIFDVLYYDQFDLRSLPLLERKEILHSLLVNQNDVLRYSDHIIDNGEAVFKHSCKLTLEGIISKQIDSTYSSKRSKSWLKVKCVKRQEFVVGGYSPPQGARDHFGALYLGVFNQDGKLDYAGNVGTGFTEKSLAEIYEQLQVLKADKSPFHVRIPASSRATWLKPVLVVEVEFTQWTDDGRLRHPSFKGIRLDKPAKEIKREEGIPVAKTGKGQRSEILQKKDDKIRESSFKITHPKKILYPEGGYTKQDVLIYYETVSDYILPFISNRPLSLVRCPENYTHCFFQRHYTESTPKALKPVAVKSKEGVENYIYLNDREGLLSLVQMGVLEIHPWGSLISQIETPDFIVIDLDPAPDVSWETVVKAAREIKSHLEEFKLTSFVKTTGGKGLHVVLPIEPKYDWDEVKNFTHVFVEFLEKNKPDLYISTMSKAKRSGKIFVDYLRNQRGATAIGVYSTRARAQAPVSAPIHWDELGKDKRGTEFNIESLPKRLLSLKHDPWEDFWKIKQSLRLEDFK